MRFHIQISVTAQEYRASSPESQFHSIGPSVCTAISCDQRDHFLSIGEPVKSFQDDPGFLRSKMSGELRAFNPFDPSAFEPENAAAVVLAYLQRAHRQLRCRSPRWFQRLSFLFLDRCIVRLHIEGYSSLPSETKEAFQRAVKEIVCVRSLQIESEESHS